MVKIRPRSTPNRRFPSSSPSSPQDARSAALFLLNHLESSQLPLDLLLESDCHGEKLLPLDRALFNHLVYGVLRWQLYLDSVMAAYTDRPSRKITPEVRNILRLALFQIFFMDRIPPSAAVNTAVNMAHGLPHGALRTAGFVNGLLRNVLRHPDRFQPPDPDKFPVAHLSVTTATPEWLAQRWVDRMGMDSATELCKAMNTIPPVTLRCNVLKNTVEELTRTLLDVAKTLTLSRTGFHAVSLDGLSCPVFRMPGFAKGRFAVQDEAAQGVGLLVSPRPGETVLDACAGLGGKTGHMAEFMKNQGRIIALDHSGKKLIRLEEEAKRLGVTIIETQEADLRHPLSLDTGMRFDRILLDAPCSGLGVLRRNPDAKWRVNESDIHRCAKQQGRFLANLAPWLRVGGTLVYAVCSTEPEENQDVIKAFLSAHPDFEVDKTVFEQIDIRPFLDANGFFRTFPHLHAMDGFFAARLIRTC
ncbi:16S rRNA (cytosine(967)-C(5))-methyltransferase RsmB [Desulfosarcina sp. OttesenSCG-928-A07]|nr:16S rRNA (cytosine(967)-C(5))-methyltransferase RsmB [Desulfosarcina sp. OttesenSCG-928-G17]MDL2329815.1 16S rRNA (cytosine(967)-C(5))-methyltransferase RsmB [Desulfosarcina sp. OttesenSCG-928-A07]